MRSIAVVNQKGGCGKTITAINLAAFLADSGKRVLLIDMDPQGHATLGLQPGAAGSSTTIAEVLLPDVNGGHATLRDARQTVLPGLDLVPSDILLSAVPERLSGVAGREARLAGATEAVRGEYDYLVVDCPPSVGLLTFNALMACSEAIVPVDPGFFSLHGIAKQLETLDLLGRERRHQVDARALITLYPGRFQFVKEVVGDVRGHLGERVFDTVIRFSIKLAEAVSHGVPITRYCRRCTGYEDYRRLSAEVMGREALAVFTLRAPGAQRVQLAGDFNRWDPASGEMSASGEVWTTSVPLVPGRYKYRYVVDGRWQSDPLNPQVEPSPFGDYDSVIVLGETRPPASS
jgi:chromosome partitioning protein